MITRAEYEDALAAIEKAITQLEPDGRGCAICGDSDHQAFECRHNPVRAMKQREAMIDAVNELHEKLHSPIFR